MGREPPLFTSLVLIGAWRSRPDLREPSAGGSSGRGRGRGWRALAAAAAEGEACWDPGVDTQALPRGGGAGWCVI